MNTQNTLIFYGLSILMAAPLFAADNTHREIWPSSWPTRAMPGQDAQFKQVTDLVFNGTPPFCNAHIQDTEKSLHTLATDDFATLQRNALASITLRIAALQPLNFACASQAEQQALVHASALLAQTQKTIAALAPSHYNAQSIFVSTQDILRFAQWAKMIEWQNEARVMLTFHNGVQFSTRDNTITNVLAQHEWIEYNKYMHQPIPHATMQPIPNTSNNDNDVTDMDIDLPEEVFFDPASSNQ